MTHSLIKVRHPWIKYITAKSFLSTKLRKCDDTKRFEQKDISFLLLVESQFDSNKCCYLKGRLSVFPQKRSILLETFWIKFCITSTKTH